MNENNVLTGHQFEDVVHEFLKKSNPKQLLRKYRFTQLGIEVDFLTDYGHCIECIEAKGGENIKENGDSWSGATRTDNVKKAICNGALLKTSHPNYVYSVYFNQPPKKGSSSHLMLQTALEHKIIDNVYFIANGAKTAMLVESEKLFFSCEYN